jgi:hypothetical protein
VGPSVRLGKGKEKGPARFWAKRGVGPARAQLGLARLLGSARPVA